MRYNLESTVMQTQKANPILEIMPAQYQSKYKENYLFDFTLLEKHVTNPILLEKIKDQCFKSADVVWKYQYVCTQQDIYSCFDYFTGNVYFQPHTVYSKSKNKKVYTIMQLVKIEWLTFKSRNSLYENFNVIQEVNDHIASNNEILEFEIA